MVGSVPCTSEALSVFSPSTINLKRSSYFSSSAGFCSSFGASNPPNMPPSC